MHMRVFAPFRGTATIKGVRKNARTALLTFNKPAVISAFVLTNALSESAWMATFNELLVFLRFFPIFVSF